MNKLKDSFRTLYERRSAYPPGISSLNHHENAFDIRYISDEIQAQHDSDFLFLLLFNEHLDKTQLKETRERLEKDYSMVGIFGIGDILAPATSVKFTLYVFSKSSPQKIWFGELLENRHAFKRRTASSDFYKNSGVLNLRFGELEPYFEKYLESIDLAIHGGKKDDYIHDAYRLFGVDASKLQHRTSVDYYKPELIEAEAKLAHEKTIALSDVAEIITPRTRSEPSRGYYIKLADAKYPLKSNSLVEVRENAPIVALERGDIVTNSFLNSAYLNYTDRTDLVATNSQIIVRIKNGRIGREYLTVYLNSERMRSYFARRRKGFIPRLSLKDLSDFPVVVPDLEAQSVAKDYLKSLAEIDDTQQRVEHINKMLFAKRPAANKPLQNELLRAMSGDLQLVKNQLVKSLFDADLSEVEACYKSGAYKACLVLCGSILEAIILDWMSEIESKDYFDKRIHTELRQMINRLKDASVISAQEAQLAHDIRDFRNLIHPQKALESIPLKREMCLDVMEKLKPIVRKRYQA